MIKLNRINALVLACGLTLSASAFFAGKANAADGVFEFSGTVAASCLVPTTSPTATTYTLNPSNAVFSATSAAQLFDCNTATVNVSSVETVASGQAGATHSFTTSPTTNLTESTDSNQDVSITVTSTWTATTGDLAAGPYSATVTVTVIPNP